MTTLSHVEGVAITGASVLSPIGTSWAATRAALKAGASGIRPITLFDASSYPTQIGGEIPDWCSHSDPVVRLGKMLDHTTAEAVRLSGINTTAGVVGLCLGLGKQPLSIESAARGIDTAVQTSVQHELLLTRAARRLHCTGPAYACCGACASGNDAIGIGMNLVRRGAAEVVVCGAADAQLGPLPLLEFAMLGALSTSSATDCRWPRPFDRHRNGLVIGEGAAMFVLENMRQAVRRGANVLGELIGYGCALSPYSITREHPDGVGPSRAMQAALQDAHLDPVQIDYLNAHGTGTIVNDPIEVRAVRQVFGTHVSSLPISSTKSMTGHLFAAAGAVELALCLMAIQDRFIPPTINYSERDAECDVDVVPNQGRAGRVKVVMSNAFGFGGQNSSLIVRAAG